MTTHFNYSYMVYLSAFCVKFSFSRIKLILHIWSWKNLWLAHFQNYMRNPILNLRWMGLPFVEKNRMIFNTKFSSQIESQMSNYMLHRTSSLFCFYCVRSFELSKVVLSGDVFFILKVYSCARGVVFFFHFINVM